MKTKKLDIATTVPGKEVFLTELKPYLYIIDENGESSAYLVIGSDKALLIDTMNGYHDLSKTVRDLTDLPLTVVNTHGHPDHIYGNAFFDKVYIHEKDLPIAEQFYRMPEFSDLCKTAGKTIPPFGFIKEGDVIDLGGKTLEIFELPGHTPGEIVLLLREDRILFTGDGVNHHLWAMLPECPAPAEMVESYDRVLFLEEKADVILHGHATDYDDIALLRAVRDGLQEIAEGHTENDEDYKWFDGVDRQHHFTVPEGKHFQQGDHVICYKKNY